MHTLRSSAARRAPGAHLLRILMLSTALTGLMTIIVADVTAAESDEPTPLALTDDTPDPAAPVAPPQLLALVVPDAITPSAPTLPELLPDLTDEPPRPRKKRNKLKYGRFEGY